MDEYGHLFKNVGVYVGNLPAMIGAGTGVYIPNPVCAILLGQSETGKVEEFICKEPLKGRYLQVQMRDSSRTSLDINEIEVTELV
jgi:hypothetical protein